MSGAPRGLFILFFIVDIGFIMYWTVTGVHLLPQEWLYRDYLNPILVHWNWSFFPIDMLVSLSGLNSIRLYGKGAPRWKAYALISLFLTSCSGLMAISFWIFHRDFDLAWWLPNLFLLAYPLLYIRILLQ